MRHHRSDEHSGTSAEGLGGEAAAFGELIAHLADGVTRCKVFYENGVPVDYLYLRVNPAFEELTGLRDVVGRRASEVLPGVHDHDPTLLATYARVASTGRPETFEAYIASVGEWFSISAYSRQREHFVALLRRTTEQRREEDERRTFMLGAERANDAIFMTAPDGTMSYVNPAFEKLYGYSKAEALGKTPRILKSGAQEPAFYERLWSSLLAKQVAAVELTNRTKDGRHLRIEATANPILDRRGELIGFLAIHRDITESRRATEALALFRALIDQSSDAIEVIDPTSGQLLDINEQGCRDLGYTRAEALALRVFDLDPGVAPSGFSELAESVRIGGPATLESVHQRKDGSAFPVEVSLRYVQLDRGYLVAVVRDVTERRRAEAARAKLEEQIQSAQKMEAVGRLAGGIAHDFNNLLSVILSYASMAAGSLPPRDPLRQDLEEIEKAGQRAADLTGQLLAFSRQQVIEPRLVDLNETLVKMDRMLRRLLGEDIDLKTVATTPLGRVLADPGQIEQVVMNLAVNARDAMPDGGRLTLETGNVTLEDHVAKELGRRPGPHVMLAVSDTGLGMDAETKARIFEPFFTTKELGKGTGLGLATVFGIVQQSGGSIWVYSEPGKGTTFKMYFPCAEESAQPAAVRSSLLPPRRGTETILLVEDEAQLLQLIAGILRRNGYRVLAAASPGDALLESERYGEKIDLLLTDVVMPGMNGRQLVERLAMVRPDMRVLYMSGYTGNVVLHTGVVDEGVAFLQKPIMPDMLLSAMRGVLDAQRDPPPSR